MSRYILVPNDIDIYNAAGQRAVTEDEPGKKVPATMSFRRFVLGLITDPQLATNMEGVLVASEIRAAVLKSSQPGAVLELPDGHWKRLKEVTERPSNGYDASFAFNLVPFMNAIVDAKSERPADDANTTNQAT